jgi:uncharacterized protein (TIGR00661 family)
MLRAVFIVQGEGRGHMTQALALAGFLRAAGHQVSRVLVGTSPFRSVPDYFVRQIDAPLETFDAPTLVPDRAGRGASTGATVRDVLGRSPSFIRATRRIRAATRNADVVVNFLDLLGGLSQLFPGERAPSVAIAHNYFFGHPGLRRLPGPALTRALVMAYVRATAAHSATRVALSFGPLAGGEDRRLTVAPPLLRPGLQDLEATDDGYLLAYALNPGYGSLLAEWQVRHPEVTVHCYLDGGEAAMGGGASAAGFHVHALDERGFLRHLAGCRAYVGSAGFESICEAFYLGKPVLAVPTDGHYEQVLNGWDAERVGAARVGTYADLDLFWEEPPVPSRDAVRDFRAWVARAPSEIVDLIERAASG